MSEKLITLLKTIHFPQGFTFQFRVLYSKLATCAKMVLMAFKKPYSVFYAIMIALGVIVSFSSTQALADEPPVVLIVAFESQRPFADQVKETIEIQLSEINVRLQVEWVAAPQASTREQIRQASRVNSATGALAVVWYDHRNNDHGFLYLADADKARILLRRIDEEDEAARAETIALVVQSAVEALLRGGTIGVKEPVLEAVEAEPVPPEREDDTTPTEGAQPVIGPFLGIDVAAGLQSRSTEHPFNIGFNAEIYGSFAPGVEVFLSYTLWNTMISEGKNALVRVARHPLGLGLRYGAYLGKFRLDGTAEFLADFVNQETTRIFSTVPTAQGQDHFDVIFSVVPGITVARSISRRIEIFGRLSAQIPFNRVEYRYMTSDGSEIIETPWSIQPRLLLGARFIIL
jgi:hypothetical protein